METMFLLGQLQALPTRPSALGALSCAAYTLCVKRIPLVRIGLLVAFSPVMAAFVFSLFNGGNMFDESSGGGGFLWFLMATLPLGFLMMFIGLILLLVNKLKPKDGL